MVEICHSKTAVQTPNEIWTAVRPLLGSHRHSILKKTPLKLRLDTTRCDHLQYKREAVDSWKGCYRASLSDHIYWSKAVVSFKVQ